MADLLLAMIIMGFFLGSFLAFLFVLDLFIMICEKIRKKVGTRRGAQKS